MTISEGISLPNWPEETVSDLDWAANHFFYAAALLTDPLCKSHETFRRICVVDALHPASTALANAIRKMSLFASLLGWASLAVVATAPGAACRALAQRLQTAPFIHVESSAEEATLSQERSFSLLSWNVCCVGGGYSISDGGVAPWSERQEGILARIIRANADVNCLYETFDTKFAFAAAERLMQAGYRHIYFNIGPKTIGVSSGILVASKFKIANPEFTPYPLEALVGRTKAASKGVFSFDLESGSELFARIFTTHMQHSEQPEFPTEEEVLAREQQMQIIVDKMKAVQDRCVVVAGDLNLGDEELQASTWKDLFEQGDLFTKKTWGGDQFCAQLVGKPVSGPLNLDHTMVAKGTGSLQTTLVETGYDPARYGSSALSDHEGLLSRIVLPQTVSK